MAEARLIPAPTTAVILAGGRGSRLGGVEKGEIMVAGKRLIDIVVGGAASAGCERTVIAGNVAAAGAETVRERPAFGGPVAGLAAAINEVETDWIMLLACDLPHAPLLCRLLAESFHAVSEDSDGLVAMSDRQVQWLAGVYRRDSVRRELEGIGDPRGVALKDLFRNMRLREVRDPDGFSRDIDTPAELARLETEETK